MRVGPGLHRRETRLPGDSDMRCGHGLLFSSPADLPPLSKMKTEHGGKGYSEGVDLGQKQVLGLEWLTSGAWLFGWRPIRAWERSGQGTGVNLPTNCFWQHDLASFARRHPNLWGRERQSDPLECGFASL